MWQDPIVAEVRQAREAHAAQFNFDLHIPPVKTEMKPALVA
jgi:hypothetical protein